MAWDKMVPFDRDGNMMLWTGCTYEEFLNTPYNRKNTYY